MIFDKPGADLDPEPAQLLGQFRKTTTYQCHGIGGTVGTCQMGALVYHISTISYYLDVCCKHYNKKTNTTLQYNIMVQMSTSTYYLW